MLWLIILVILFFGLGGGYWGYSSYGTGGGIGIFGAVLIIALLYYLLRGRG